MVLEKYKFVAGRYYTGRDYFFRQMPAFEDYENEKMDTKTYPFTPDQEPTFQTEPREPLPHEFSVYYWWWEFLKRHEGYKRCCERGGAGKYANLYADWGNIYDYSTNDFWDWWSTSVSVDGVVIKRGEYLFGETAMRRPSVATEIATDVQTLTVNLPLEVRTKTLMRTMREFLKQHKKQVQVARSISTAKYPYINNIRTPTLHRVLRAYDIHQHYGKTMTQYEKYRQTTGQSLVEKHSHTDLPTMESKRRETMEFRRMLTMAEDYIYFAGLGEFPKRRTAAERAAK